MNGLGGVNGLGGAVPRSVHPAAWWLWAIALAVAVSRVTNPFVLLTALGVAALVVVARRGSSPWARSFRLYLWLGAFIVAVRAVLHIVAGLKTGETVILPLPEVALPSWASGINLLGDVRLEGFVAAVCEGLRLAVMIACIGAANALANPKRLLRSLPGALSEVGSAIVVTITVAPQLADSVQRVMRARALRGESARGIRALPRVALPVLEDTLDRSIMLAAAMDSRGYGRRRVLSPAVRVLTAVCTLGGLLLSAIGIYGVLDATTPGWLGAPALTAGVGMSLLGIWLGGRANARTTYRRDPWGAPEWVTVACGTAAVVGVQLTLRGDAASLGMPVAPLAVPALPLLALGGLLVAGLPAFVTPEPPRPAPRGPASPLIADSVRPDTPRTPLIAQTSHPNAPSFRTSPRLIAQTSHPNAPSSRTSPRLIAQSSHRRVRSMRNKSQAWAVEGES
ncbi:energy-coupling factor transport system permease protein [Knoellia remsis]|uniref:Energy-coupling factor transport system permease protein n=1 Tax=Knoellia remsis TaxID=407159 RepID=A0A2T0UEQ0_9MICO|nr:energy-coupling factor transporter transmembrane component T [Knoellia remsis]PRY56297.1 energy-coupling factor transport system permease protein [Knoellia remsis]